LKSVGGLQVEQQCLKGQAPTQEFLKEKGVANQTLLVNEHSASRLDANYDR